ncbi:hypothetical protein ACF1AJ_20410 [Leifsonia sp. NPDC014704]|uniref:hypothetical protein n=1 Tax=Leifsonia sp. NPDC014704 TaxID=3364123 RepID=UPI0036F476D3
MSDESEVLLKLIGAKSRVRVLQGTFVAAAASGYTVDVGGGRIPADLGTAYLPEVNEIVWVWAIDDKYFVMGPVTPKPDRGTVVSVASGIATLTTALGTVTAPYSGSTPSAGQVMKLAWHGGPFASLMSTSPPPPAPPAPPAPATTTHVDDFYAIDAGSYRAGSGWWTPQVRAGDTNFGAWFYGTKIADTIPATAQIKRVLLYLSPASIGGANPNYALHPHPSKPGGAPALTTFTSGLPATTGDLDLPTSVGDALKAGGGSAGVGINHGGNSIFNSLAADGLSGRIRITSVY